LDWNTDCFGAQKKRIFLAASKRKIKLRH
jgi:hypothetical protein